METPENGGEETPRELTPVQRVDVWELPSGPTEETREQVTQALQADNET